MKKFKVLFAALIASIASSCSDLVTNERLETTEKEISQAKGSFNILEIPQDSLAFFARILPTNDVNLT